MKICITNHGLDSHFSNSAHFLKTIFFVAAISFTFSVNAQWDTSTSGVIYTTTDSVGIGISNPSTILHLDDYIKVEDNHGAGRVFEGYRAGSNNVGIKLENGGGYWTFGRSQSGDFVLSPNNLSLNLSSTFVVKESGFVGIGVASPLYNLHVEDGDIAHFSRGTESTFRSGIDEEQLLELNISSQHSYLDYYNLTNDALDHIFYIRNAALGTGNNDIRFQTSSEDQFTIRANGNVGVGTSGPNARFEIVDRNGGNVDNLRFMYSSATNGMLVGDNEAKLTFATQISGANANPIGAYMVLDHSTTNVGIGTTSPTAKLYIEDASASSSTYSLNIHNKIKVRGDGVFYWGVNADQGLLSWDNGKVMVGGMTSQDLALHAGSNEHMRITSTGNVGIGTNDPGSFKLAVEGQIGARSLKVTTAAWADYVFAPEYKLLSLKETEEFIEENGHLPNVPSAQEVEENGFALEEMDAKLLEKIEELTLHLIEQQKEIEALKAKLQEKETTR